MTIIVSKMPETIPSAVDRMDEGVEEIPQMQNSDEPTSDQLAEEEIRQVQMNIQHSLEHIIEVGGEARDVGRDTNSKLMGRRSTMEAINRSLHEQSRAQSQAKYNIKTGFSWTGALKKKIGRGSSMQQPEPKDEITPLPLRRVRHSSSEGHIQSAVKEKQNKDVKENLSVNMPEGYDAQLNAIESILEDLARQSVEMDEELSSHNEALDVLDNKLLDVTDKTMKQNSRMKIRFRLK